MVLAVVKVVSNFLPFRILMGVPVVVVVLEGLLYMVIILR